MSADIEFPKPPCVICSYFMLAEDVPPAFLQSPGVGNVCTDCTEHVNSAWVALAATPGLMRHMISDEERNSRGIES